MWAGFGVCDDGLVIDLSPMKGIRVDPSNHTVRVEGGCVWGDVDHATHPFGLATPSGFISSTGVGGLTLGGGIGYLTRTHGLTIDNLLGVDMVLADGSFVTQRQGQSDLFWAVRGGGGNFGVVTSFLFKLHPISTVYGGPILWPMADAAETMRWYARFIVKAPEDINGCFAFLTVPPALRSPSIPAPTRRCAPSSGAIPARLIRPSRRSRRFAPSALRCWTSQAQSPSQHCKVCSMRSIRLACSGIGKPISCDRPARSKPSPCM